MHFDSFYTIDPSQLPEDAEFYHNVYLVAISVSQEVWNEIEEWEGLDSVCYMDKLTDPFPKAVVFHIDENLGEKAREEDLEEMELEENELENLMLQEEPYDFIVEEFPHAVVQITSDGEITWYDGKSSDEEENPWLL